jgi:hypothetical protein
MLSDRLQHSEKIYIYIKRYKDARVTEESEFGRVGGDSLPQFVTALTTGQTTKTMMKKQRRNSGPHEQM